MLGHYINDCPLLLANPNDLTRIKRVTGIPKSFLTPVDSHLGENLNGNKKAAAPLRKTMISYDGSKVVFTPNTSEWQKFSSIASASKQAAAIMDEPDYFDPQGSPSREVGTTEAHAEATATEHDSITDRNSKRFKTSD